MNINPLSSNIINILTSDESIRKIPEVSDFESGSFADVLAQSWGTVVETDAVDKISSLELLTGQSDDLSGLMLDIQKAELSLTLALQIRNKVLDAYNEIMRMQV